MDTVNGTLRLARSRGEQTPVYVWRELPGDKFEKVTLAPLLTTPAEVVRQLFEAQSPDDVFVVSASPPATYTLPARRAGR